MSKRISLRAFVSAGLRFRAAVVLAIAFGLVAVLVPVRPSGATPFAWGEGVQPLRWPANKTIRIYIQADPVPAAPDTSALLQQGMQRWVAEMAPRGITIEVNVGDPPAPPPTNVVRCQYRAVGSRLDGDPADAPALGDENEGLAGCGGPAGGNLNSGQIIIRDDIWAASAIGSDGQPNGWSDAQREDYIRNLGAHEITHVLGLADDGEGEVTDHLQGSTATTFNDHDREEIGTLYPVLEQPQGGANGTHQQMGTNQHNYQFQYNGVPNAHVPLIALDIAPSVIQNIQAPPGWIVLDPRDPGRTNIHHPFYQNYMVDGHPFPAPWNPNVTPPVLLRALSGAAALSPTNPAMTVVIFATPMAPVGPIECWSGGPNPQMLLGPVPPGGGVPAVTDRGAVVLTIGIIVAAAIILRRPRSAT